MGTRFTAGNLITGSNVRPGARNGGGRCGLAFKKRKTPLETIVRQNRPGIRNRRSGQNEFRGRIYAAIKTSINAGMQHDNGKCQTLLISQEYPQLVFQITVFAVWLPPRRKPTLVFRGVISMGKNRMAFAMRIAVLACLSSTLGLAESWSGTLVDSRCWDSEENNTRATSTYVDRDANSRSGFARRKQKRDLLWLCYPVALTSKLDAAGNERAAELVRKSDKRNAVAVVITGETNGNTIKVNSISMAR